MGEVKSSTKRDESTIGDASLLVWYSEPGSLGLKIVASFTPHPSPDFMPHSPEFESFASLAGQHDRVPVWRRILGDSLTPPAAFARLDDGGTACLFESVVGGEKVGRYSFLAVGPSQELSAWRNRVETTGPEGTEKFESANPLDELRQRMQGVSVAHPSGLPPFLGGAVGYAGYDVIRYTEHLPDPPEDDRNLPDLSFAFYDDIVVFDNVNKVIIVIALAETNKGESDPREAYETAACRVDQIVEKLAAPSTTCYPTDIPEAGEISLEYRSNMDQAAYEDAVRQSVEYIRAGDIFQVVISQRLEIDIQSDPFEIYRTLRVVNPSPFMFFLRTPHTTLVGSSPEIMCRVVDGKTTVRPLAGTRRRGATDEEDQRLAEELLADEKERAEHVMLVDLGRNDVGKVAEYGTVELTDVMTVEKYSHVMHITSNVCGQLREGVDAFDALAASLPAGTVSGAPKVRAMEIIDTLEPHRRGPYAGAIGYLDYGGNMDTCIALRTMVIIGSKVYVQAGAGIVADSDPTAEYHETLSKARGLLRAIELTEERVGKG